MVSPTGRQDSTTIVVVQSQEATSKVQNKSDEDEHINRLVQENNDVKKSVKLFGKRTDVDGGRHDNNLKRVVPFDGPFKMAIQKYVGDYEGLWPLLLEPDGEFQIDEGQIPCLLDLGNVGRRMVSGYAGHALGSPLGRRIISGQIYCKRTDGAII